MKVLFGGLKAVNTLVYLPHFYLGTKKLRGDFLFLQILFLQYDEQFVVMAK